MEDSRDTVIMRVPDEQLEGEDFVKFFSKAGTIKVTVPHLEIICLQSEVVRLRLPMLGQESC